mmetsp:Transcript_25541/g.31459  ORF Transcript_25541/g.31459 Transcript_25541/m.31459 type:complete len:873 (-) Transcript_25541:132-2750(-)
MTIVSQPSHNRRGRRKNNRSSKSSSKCTTLLAKVFLSFALLWTFFVLFGSGSQTPSIEHHESFAKGKSGNSKAAGKGTSNVRGGGAVAIERNILPMIDPGPQPQVAFVLVATHFLSDPVKSMSTAIESILEHTNRERILSIVAVFPNSLLKKEGLKNEHVLQYFEELDLSGVILHQHGDVKHVHTESDAAIVSDKNQHVHGTKIKVMIEDDNDDIDGKNFSVAQSRRNAAQFIQILHEEHLLHGPKHKETILTFVRPDSTIESDDWLHYVADALLTSSPPNPKLDEIAASTTASKNAVSFAIKSTVSKKEFTSTSLDLNIQPVHTTSPLKSDLSLTNGRSYPTPILEGSVTSLLLSTYFNFLLPTPNSHLLKTTLSADIELSFSLWLCGNGIDILTDLHAEKDIMLMQRERDYLSDEEKILLVKDWMMNDGIGESILQRLQVDDASSSITTSKNNDLKKCRTFKWYTKEVNVLMEEELKNLTPPEAKSEQNHINKSDEKIKPSQPLREINQEIISKAPMVDISFVDASNNHEEYPHLGAKDENDNFGYRHDETYLKKNPPKFEFTKEEVGCSNHDGNYKMLTDKVNVDFASHEAREREANEQGGKRRAKLFCMVYTIEKNHDRIPPILETWGKKCDGFIVASNKTDKKIGTVNIPHEGPEEYNNIWQKVRSMWSYVYDTYYEDYDWFHIGGDDLYVIVENLRLYVESEEIQLASNGGEFLPNGNESTQKPLFLGRRFAEQGNMERIFNSGGSGYTMNKAALKSLVVTAFPTCMPHLHTFAEDVMVAQCLRNKIQVVPFDTKDEDGGERYMPFQPRHHLNYRLPKDPSSDWYANYSIDIKTGLDHCAAKSVAFHYIKPDLMKRMHAILYGQCA